MATDQRMNADERREEVLRVASKVFAESGYAGASTEEIARRAGISQPYVFRLFGSKRELFVTVVDACFQRTARTFERASKGLSGEEALIAMGFAYRQLLEGPELLLVEMHAFMASVHDPVVRSTARAGMRRIWEAAMAASGLGADEVRGWLATGMLLNVVAALGLEELDEPWARQVLPFSGCEELPALGPAVTKT